MAEIPVIAETTTAMYPFDSDSVTKYYNAFGEMGEKPLTDSESIKEITEVLRFCFEMIFTYITEFVKFLRSFKFFGEVSYFDFFIALIVMGIVITYLLNVARNPGVETISTTRARERRNEADERRRAADIERKNRDDYREYKHDRYQRVSKVKIRSYNDWKEYNNR